MKTIVVGAGAAGMSAALISLEQGHETHLIEAHSIPGGCASWFVRKGFSFDVGATTLSGLKSHHPLRIFEKNYRAKLNFYPCDPGIVFHLSGKKIHRYATSEKWLMELALHFPSLNHAPFWKWADQTSEWSWHFLSGLKTWPPKSFRQFFYVIKGVKLLPLMFQSLQRAFTRFYGDQGAGQEKKDLLKLLNALSLISAQNTLDQVPSFIGALAMTYPAETFAPKGGMRGLFEEWLKLFKERGGHWHPRERCEKISFQNRLWSINVKTAKGLEKNYEASRLILNSTVWDWAKLGYKKKKFPQQAWSAFTLYAGVKWNKPTSSLYHLVIVEDDAKQSGLKDYFFSLSHPEDEGVRAPQGWQTLTLSWHEKPGDWFDLDAQTYTEKKQKITEQIQKHLWIQLQTLGEGCEVQWIESGTPRTFAHYTLRPLGQVGGWPHQWSFPFWRWPWPKQGKGLLQLGDTVFPGQGIVATVQGSLLALKQD
jgi:phytoene dehydrogenase-like protein